MAIEKGGKVKKRLFLHFFCNIKRRVFLLLKKLFTILYYQKFLNINFTLDKSSAVVRHKRPQRLQDGKEGHLIIDLFKKTPKPTTFCWVLPFIPLMFHLH